MEQNINEVDTEEMEIKIQTMDNVFQIKIRNDNTVLQLKDKITTLYKIPIQSQRLIFQGKLMKDEEKLSFYKITSQCVLHLVARDLEETQPRNQPGTSSSLPQRTEPVIENRIPLLFVPMRTNQRRRRVVMPHYDISECFEALYQNMITIDNLTQCKTGFNKDDPKLEAFDFKKTKYEVGQWIDAKDTIDQWLEAQVIQVQDNKAYIHYNGWGTRWDEWISFDSPRMKHFKFYTLQPPSSSFMSPYPGVPCDSNIEPQSRSIDSFFYLEKTKNYIGELLNVMERLCELRKKEKTILEKGFLNRDDQELLFLTTQIIPFMDRLGRMLSDMSLQFSHLVINPNLYPQMLMGYKRNQMFNQEEEVKTIEINPKGSHDAHSSETSLFKKENQTDSIIRPNEFPSSLMSSIQEVNSEITSKRQNQSTSTSSLIEHHEVLSRNDFIHSERTSNNNVNSNNSSSNQEIGQPPIQTNLGYNLTTSSNELPFVQRVFSSFTRSDRIISPSSHIAKLNQHEKAFPKVNLQLPALLSTGEVMSMTGSSPFSEPNFDIYVHTFNTTPTVRNEPNTQSNGNTTTERPNNPSSSIVTDSEQNSNRPIQDILQPLQSFSNLSEGNEQVTNLVRQNENNNPLQTHKFFQEKSTQTSLEDLNK